ncbi:hypothetical protein GCM10008929_10840 [Alkalibacterium psychrotolerans]
MLYTLTIQIKGNRQVKAIDIPRNVRGYNYPFRMHEITGLSTKLLNSGGVIIEII